MFKAIVIQSAALETVTREMLKAAGTETGGALTGHIHNDELVVTAASGPGPRAKLEKYSVLIDGEHAERFCNQVRRKSFGEDDYVGDWHCHLANSLKPSDMDHRAMQTMAEFGFSPPRQPISVIWSKPSGRARGYYYDRRSRKLRRMRVRHESQQDS